MKLSNIFKKHSKTVAKANVEKLEKNQLEKVVGGTVVSSKVTLIGGGASAASYA